jgi:hypothetical protein
MWLFWQREFLVVINRTKNGEAAQQEAKRTCGTA